MSFEFHVEEFFFNISLLDSGNFYEDLYIFILKSSPCKGIKFRINMI